MATNGNAGSFIIEVEDGTAAGVERVLKSLAGMQAKADKALAGKGPTAKSAELYRKEWEKEESQRISALQKAAEKEKAIRDAVVKKAQDSVKQSYMPLAQGNSALDLATRGVAKLAQGWQTLTEGWQAAVSAAPQLAVSLASITAAVAALDAAMETSLQNQKISGNLQIDISGAREAFQGYVSDVDLAKAANRAFALGVVQNGKEFEMLSAGVKAISESLGEDYLFMLDSAVVGLGRQSALVLDNLGIILDQEKAQKMYAASLGITVDQMSAMQKQQAFTKAGLLLIGQAADKASGQVNGLASQYAKAKVQMDNLKNSMLGFDDSLAVTREKMRQLSEEDLEHLTFADALSEGSPAAKAFAQSLSSVGLTLRELRELSQSTGKSLRELIELEQADRWKKEVEGIKLKNEETAKGYKGKADALEHQAEVLSHQENKEAEILGLQHKALELRRQAAVMVGDTTAQLEAQRKIELLLATDAERQREKAKGSGSGPSAADRLKAENDAILGLMQDQLRLAESMSALRHTELQDAGTLAQMRLDAAHAELELEKQVLEITKTKNSVERIAKEARLKQIEREMDLLSVDFQIEERKAVNDLIDQSIAKESARAKAIAQTEAQAIATEQKRLVAEEQRIQQVGALALANARTNEEKARIQIRLDADLHQQRLRQIEEQRRASEAAFKIQEADPNANLAQIAHDRKMAFMDLEMQKRAEVEAQATRIAQAEAQRLQMTVAKFQEISGGIQSITSQVSGIVTTEVGRQRGIEDEAHAAKIQKMNEAAAAQSAALDREIEANKNNAMEMSRLRARKAKLEEANRKAVEKAEAKHQEKRKRQEMRAAGIQLLIQGAVEVGQAAAAFASFNFIQGALHTAAAALNIGYGVALMSGRIPTGGGGGNGGGGGGDSGVGSDTGKESSGAQKTPESVPGQAATKQSNMARSPKEAARSDGGVTFNGAVTINASGKVDKDSAEAFGFGVKKSIHSREGLA